MQPQAATILLSSWCALSQQGGGTATAVYIIARGLARCSGCCPPVFYRTHLSHLLVLMDALCAQVHQGERAGAPWSADDYVRFIDETPGLRQLAQTPFALRVMADALPRLSASGGEGRAGRHHGEGASGSQRGAAGATSAHVLLRSVTRARVYAAFMEECWEEGERRRRRAPIPGLPYDFDGPASYTNYCQDLAVAMFASGQVCHCVSPW